MALMEKSKMMAFAKKQATPPLAAIQLNKKRAMAKPPPAQVPGALAAPHPGGPQTAPGGPVKPAVAMLQKKMGMGHPEPHAAPEAPHPGEDSEVYIHELVEEAAQEAEAGKDQDLEDTVAGYTSKGAEDVPHWAEDPAKWKEAADAVGLGIPETADRYDEPFVVAAYLYKKLGGPVTGLSQTEVPEAPGGAQGADMTQPGAAAKAIHARAQVKGPAEGTKPAVMPPGHPAAPPKSVAPAKPISQAPKPGALPSHAQPDAVGKPAAVPGGQHTDAGALPGEGGDELKQMLDEAAQQAATSPDPAIMEKLQSDPPVEGVTPVWATEPDKWAKAEEAVKPHWTEYPEPFVVVAHVYKNMGGNVQ